MKALAASLLAFWVPCGAALADQCEVLTLEQASAAMRLLKKGTAVAHFCEPCGDSQPGAPRAIARVRLTDGTVPSTKAVEIDGKEVDLAYLFMRKAGGADNVFTNVAAAVECPAQGVSPEITIPSVPAVPPVAAVKAGSWHAVLTTTVSDCPQKATGDESEETWTFEVANGQFTVAARGGDSDSPSTYHGAPRPDGVLLLRGSTDVTGGKSSVTLELRKKGPSGFRGKRVVQNPNCTITMDVRAIPQ